MSVAAIQSLQERVEASYQARVMGLLESVSAGALGAGYLIGGVVGSLAPTRAVFALAGAGLMACALAAFAAVRAPAPLEPVPHPAAG